MGKKFTSLIMTIYFDVYTLMFSPRVAPDYVWKKEIFFLPLFLVGAI